MSGIVGQALVRVLRDTRERRVLLCRRQEGVCVTRILRMSTLPRHFERLVQHAVLEGRGSFAALGDHVAMTLEGYAVAARLLRDPGEPPRWPRAVDAGVTSEGHVFVTTSWIEGTPLHELPGPLTSAAREAAMEAILDVIVALHDRGVAYGDLKLANLVLRPDGGVSLIDLDTIREVPGAHIGAPSRDRTESWAAPEQLRRHETWLGSDTWALGRVLAELWGEELPPGWAPALEACRAAEPTARPTVRSLRDHLGDPDAPLVDAAGRACEPPYSAFGQPDPLPGGATERVPDAPAGGATERVADTGAPVVVPPPVPPVKPRPAAGGGGCAGFLVGLSKAALAAVLFGGLALCGLGITADSWIRNAADREAESLLAKLKVHKTDPAHNGKDERDRLAREAEALWDRHETPRTCAVRALALVWRQRWHFDADWSQPDFDAASVAVNEPKCAHEPEAALAKATLYAGACRRRAAGVVSATDCALALAALEPFWAALPEGEGAHWLRVEAAWQEVRARSALVGRYVETGNAEAQGEAAKALARCATAEPWMMFAPVNGPELQEECMVSAGYVSDVEAFLHYADLRLATLPTERKSRATVLTHLYTAAGLGCTDSRYSYNKRGKPVATGGSWCLAVGHLARRCPAEATAAMVEGSLGDPHPWLKLATPLASREGPCLE